MAIVSNLDLIALAFGACNLLRLASYVPQIIAVARDRNGATAISFSCWTIWVGANATTGLYAWINLGDLGLAMIGMFNAACCTVVLAIAARKRFEAGLRGKRRRLRGYRSIPRLAEAAQPGRRAQCA
jgi:hypothetical protein